MSERTKDRLALWLAFALHAGSAYGFYLLACVLVALVTPWDYSDLKTAEGAMLALALGWYRSYKAAVLGRRQVVRLLGKLTQARAEVITLKATRPRMHR